MKIQTAITGAMALIAGACIAPCAFAQEKTTLEWLTTKGSVLKVAGMEFPTTYTPDGKFSAAEGRVTGTWRIVGDTLCVAVNPNPAESCTLYPPGKKPGDEFEVQSAQGAAIVQINK
jgi:hypothetical protein